MKAVQFAPWATMMLLLAACSKEPVANFSYVSDDLTAPAEVHFTNLSEDADSYLWDFNDGTTSTEENPIHTFEVYGSLTVTLTAKGRGGQSTAERQLVIKRPTTYIVRNYTSVTLYNVESYYWDPVQEIVTAFYAHGTMASNTESPEIITLYSPLDLYFELADGTRCIVWDSYPMVTGQLNYMDVDDNTDLYIYDSTAKSARAPGTPLTHAFLLEMKEKGQLVRLGDLQ